MALKDSLKKFLQLQAAGDRENIAKFLDENFSLLADEFEGYNLDLEKKADTSDTIQEIATGFGMTATTSILENGSKQVLLTLDENETTDIKDKRQGESLDNETFFPDRYLLPFITDPMTGETTEERLSYIRGANNLDIYLNGLMLIKGQQWQEPNDAEYGDVIDSFDVLVELEGVHDLSFIVTSEIAVEGLQSAVIKNGIDIDNNAGKIQINANDIQDLKDANVPVLTSSGSGGIVVSNASNQINEVANVKLNLNDNEMSIVSTSDKRILYGKTLAANVSKIIKIDDENDQEIFSVNNDGNVFSKGASIIESVSKNSYFNSIKTSRTGLTQKAINGFAYKIWPEAEFTENNASSLIIDADDVSSRVVIELPVTFGEKKSGYYYYTVSLFKNPSVAGNLAERTVAIERTDGLPFIGGLTTLFLDDLDSARKVEIFAWYDFTDEDPNNHIVQYGITSLRDFSQKVINVADLTNHVVEDIYAIESSVNTNPSLFEVNNANGTVKFNGENNSKILIDIDLVWDKEDTGGDSTKKNMVYLQKSIDNVNWTNEFGFEMSEGTKLEAVIGDRKTIEMDINKNEYLRISEIYNDSNKIVLTKLNWEVSQTLGR